MIGKLLIHYGFSSAISKRVLQFIFNKLGFQVLSTERYKNLNEMSLFSASNDTEMTSRILTLLPIIKKIDHVYFKDLVETLKMSRSQLGQDIFTLSILNFKRNGFFVEFGATNGVDYSNTLVMEKLFGWTGILSEPAKSWHRHLYLNRTAFIDTNAVWKTSNSQLVFNETDSAEYSTIQYFSDLDMHKNIRLDGKQYDVKTISLNDLLQKYNAPSVIDYLSIDTEGSEIDILESFNFNHYTFKVITVEHNYTDNRGRIYELLTSNRYRRVNEDISKFDDWYVYSA
jgi:FkbM family methyltransferase